MRSIQIRNRGFPLMEPLEKCPLRAFYTEMLAFLSPYENVLFSRDLSFAIFISRNMVVSTTQRCNTGINFYDFSKSPFSLYQSLLYLQFFPKRKDVTFLTSPSWCLYSLLCIVI